MNKVTRFSRRTSIVALAVLLAGAASLPGLFTVHPALADQVANRSIEMSDSAVSGGSIPSGLGSGTNVSYSISFDLSTSSGYTSGKMNSYIIDFCSESPLIGETCTAPGGLDLSAATATSGNTSTWTITTTGSQIKASDATGIADGSTVTLEMGGITNPNTVAPFYARIYTYADNTFGSTSSDGAYADPQDVGGNVDYGGVALTTVTPVNVTAKVQEEITFCVASATISPSCANAGANPPDLTIGHGTPTQILDGSAVDTATAYMQTSTNAQAGAAIRMKNDNTCGGLSDDSGATCGIPPSTSGFDTAANGSTTGNAAYGLNVTDNTDGIGTMSADSPYSTPGTYAMDYIVGGATGVTSTYGSQIADSSRTGPVSNVDNTLTFAATASNTTPAGIYTANMVLIATGTF